jgi:hypothetical protein
MSLPQLLAAWREWDLTLADVQADLLVDLARRAVSLGESLLAFEIASLGL